MTPREILFRSYARTHLEALDGDEGTKVAWFRGYARSAYLPHLTSVAKDRARVLDLGCSGGYLLRALQDEGFRNLHGVDISPDDAQRASERIALAQIECGDAQQYLLARPRHFDVIVAKAVLEHVEKDRCLEFLRSIRTGLRQGGIALVDVPNMDWLFATHERYMDYTHEAGFTRESLSQVMRNVFDRVEVVPVDFCAVRTRAGRIKKGAARRLLTLLLTWAEPEAGGTPLWARSLLAVARVGEHECSGAKRQGGQP